MDQFLKDIRFAFRVLVRSPLVATAAALSLGLGIGANASIFSAVDVFMIRPLDFDQADDLVVVWMSSQSYSEVSSSVPDYLDWRAGSRTLDLAAYTRSGVNLTGGERPERVSALLVTSNFFDVLRKRPVVGRGFEPDDERVGGPGVVVLGDALWKRRFGADPDIVGRMVQHDGQPFEVVGVMPPRVGFGNTDPDVWIPLRFSGEEPRNNHFLSVLGRLRDGTDLEAARTDLDAIQSRLAAEYPATNAAYGITVRRLQDEWFDEGFKQGSLIASTAVLFVLLIACANVANLLLARAAGREREIALRGALGAGRSRVVRQLMTESLILAVAGGALGVGLAMAGIRGIRGLFPPSMVGIDGITLNGRVLAYTVAITLGSGIVFGLAPAIRSARLNLHGLLTDGGRGHTATRGGRIRTGLVVGEISLALVLLVSSALLVEGFVKIRTADPGFRIDDVVTLAVTMPESRVPDPEQVVAFETELLDRVAALPGVLTVGATSLLPMAGNSARYYTVPAEPPPEPGREPVVSYRNVTPGYFEAMDIRLVTGRTFNRADTRDSRPVVVINELMAAFHWPGRNPIGERITFGGVDHEIIGLVGDTRDSGPDDEPGRMAYLSAFQNETRTMRLVVHTELPPERVAEAIRGAVREIDPEQPVYGLSTMAEATKDEISGALAMTKVLASLALIAFVLSAVGVYGVMAYSISQRTMEMGIRMALGAQRGSVMGLVIRRGALITGLGIAIGLAAALGVTRLLSFFLYGVSPFDPGAFASVTATMAFTGLVASWLPARRATRVDPMLALRAE